MEDLNDVSPYLLLKTRVEAEVRGKPPKLAFCDYIADRIRNALNWDCLSSHEQLLKTVSKINSDLHPVGGYLLTTQKTIEVTDRNGARYLVTVEEIEHQTPCNLPMAECPSCDNHEWHAAHARDESREGDE